VYRNFFGYYYRRRYWNLKFCLVFWVPHSYMSL
jgi:hypothetical protein